MRMRGKYSSRLSKKQSYLQIALNSTLSDAASIIDILPASDRILIEAGTPLIKRYGAQGIRQLREWWEYKLQGVPLGASTEELQRLAQQRAFQEGVKKLFGNKVASAVNTGISEIKLPYVVADLKTMDRGATEAELAASAGASGAIALGSAPKETLDTFISACHANGIDAMIDMMNVEYPLAMLTALKTPPDVVLLHRGVDEERDNRQKMLPLHEIRRIKGRYDVLIAVAGGDTPREVQSAAFNDADIVVVWKSVYQKTSETSALVEGFLKTMK
jgi:bifunctional enzyme Fae/Hps